MTSEGYTVLVILCMGTLFFGWLVAMLFVRPEVFWRFFDHARDSRPYFRDDDAYQGMIFFLPLLLFLVFGCGLCVFGVLFLQSLAD